MDSTRGKRPLSLGSEPRSMSTAAAPFDIVIEEMFLIGRATAKRADLWLSTPTIRLSVSEKCHNRDRCRSLPISSPQTIRSWRPTIRSATSPAARPVGSDSGLVVSAVHTRNSDSGGVDRVPDIPRFGVDRPKKPTRVELVPNP